MKLKKITKIEYIEDEREYYDLTIPDTHCYCLGNGMVVHNCGISVQEHHINQLPIVQGPKNRRRRFLIGDSIEGWADSIKVLVESYYEGKSDPDFDYRDIRKKGDRLITSGGKAPGPDPLRVCINQIRSVLNNAIGRKLRSDECSDIMCHIADAVLSGGIRRAALIILFSFDDLNMMSYKAGTWYELHPERGRANISVVLKRDEITEEQFSSLFNLVKLNNTGEPGFFLTNSLELLCNPCGEVSLSDCQFCNLVEINGDDIKDQQDLNERSRVASFIATLQASYTDFHYLREKWKEVSERDALLGVGITGICSGNVLNLNLEEAGKIVLEENERVAKIIGINVAKRTTTVKPSGCLEYSTKIKTNKGNLSLEEIFLLNDLDYKKIDIGFHDIKEDIYIYDKDNNSQIITKLFNNGKENCYEIEMEDGFIFRCTGNHRFLLENGEWKRADRLKEEDDIKSY